MTAAARRQRFTRRTGVELAGLDHRQARRLMRRVAARELFRVDARAVRVPRVQEPNATVVVTRALE